jgi:murein DD-endopeptidase MepM/ murein hydrolase activator NlpD
VATAPFVPARAEVVVAGEALPSPVADPLRFVFPSAAPPPVSAWRPPLYPTPWAPTQYDHFFFARPIPASEVNWPLANYRYGGVFWENVVHTGIDIPAPRGTDVLAAGPGKVIWAGHGLFDSTEDPYGLAVVIKHDFGYQGQSLYTVYGHMDEIFVFKGQHLEGGERLGLVGDTGKVSGVHLHFEVRIGNNDFFGSRNPELWLSPPQGWGLLAGRMTDSNGRPLIHETLSVRSYATNRIWTVRTYGEGAVNSDEYYQENVVMGDLPEGDYQIWVTYEGSTYALNLEILPGMVTYFTFHGRDGFETLPPPEPEFATPASPYTPTPKFTPTP